MISSSLESYRTALEFVFLLVLLKIGRLARGYGLFRVADLALLGGFLSPVCDDKPVMVAAWENPGNSAMWTHKQSVSNISLTSENG